MDESTTLRSVIEEAINSFCAANGLGFPTSFVYCVSRIDAEGENVLTLGGMERQTTAQSMGLAAYLSKSFDFEAEQELSSYTYWANHDDEDED
jgi:hypothetical protein